MVRTPWYWAKVITRVRSPLLLTSTYIRSCVIKTKFMPTVDTNVRERQLLLSLDDRMKYKVVQI